MVGVFCSEESWGVDWECLIIELYTLFIRESEIGSILCELAVHWELGCLLFLFRLREI